MLERARELAQSIFQINQLYPIQEQVIERALGGQHSLLLMPTGMGKSICYQLPALLQDNLTIVISPLIALMNDQVSTLQELHVDAEFINSSLNSRERSVRYQKLADGAYKLIYVSPERFYKDEFKQAIAGRKVDLLAVDEAHCISQWGSDFRPAYTQLADFRKILGNPPTLALTATATPRVQKDILEQLELDPGAEIFHAGIERPNLHLSVEYSFAELEKFGRIFELLHEIEGTKIIYFNLIKNLEAFSAYLDERKLKYWVYHGKLPAEVRNRSLKNFQKGQNIVMLATNAFGMGINKADVRAIIHAEISDSLEAYYQEIGRAGRDGKDSKCILFYDQNDLAVQMDFLKAKNPQRDFIESAYRAIGALQQKGQNIDYVELQEQLVFRGKHDHRLQTVLNLFDRYEITTGEISRGTLELVGALSEKKLDEEHLQQKAEIDQARLVKMVQYANADGCRKQFVVDYFGFDCEPCKKCDNCQKNYQQ